MRNVSIVRFIVAGILLLITCGCGVQKGREIVDRTGREVVIKGPINRIISTAPSNTEIIVDLGMADKLIAIDPYSRNVSGIPENLALIDFSFPDAEQIISLEPDLIIANGHNVTGSGEDPFRLLREMGIPVAYISMSKSVCDIYDDITFIASLLRVEERGLVLVDYLKAHVDEFTEKAALTETKRTVYIEISAAPEMITFGRGSYINDMISIIGGRNIFEDDWIVFPSAEAIIERNPDVILTSVDYLDDPVSEIKNRYGFSHINAVANNRVFRIDTDSLVRPSSRIIKALEQMADAVYPEAAEANEQE